jgi:superfamily I DNA/RNA helicase
MGIAQQCRTVMELVEKLRMMFSDKVEGVVFSSIHRSKGLEAKNVYILHGELLPHPKAREGEEMEQEMNCKFVAITRSLDRLIWVTEDDDA